jgi:hypothetical protein
MASHELLPERLGVKRLEISVATKVTVKSKVNGRAEVFESRVEIPGPRISLGGSVSNVRRLNACLHRCCICVRTVGKALFLKRFLSLKDRPSRGIEIDRCEGDC